MLARSPGSVMRHLCIFRRPMACSSSSSVAARVLWNCRERARPSRLLRGYQMPDRRRARAVIGTRVLPPGGRLRLRDYCSGRRCAGAGCWMSGRTQESSLVDEGLARGPSGGVEVGCPCCGITDEHGHGVNGDASDSVRLQSDVGKCSMARIACVGGARRRTCDKDTAHN